MQQLQQLQQRSSPPRVRAASTSAASVADVASTPAPTPTPTPAATPPALAHATHTSAPTPASRLPVKAPRAAARVRAPKQVVDRAAYLVLARGCSTNSVAAAFGLKSGMLSKHIQRLRLKRKSAGSAVAALPGAATTDAAHTDEELRAFVEEIAKKLQS